MEECAAPPIDTDGSTPGWSKKKAFSRDILKKALEA